MVFLNSALVRAAATQLVASLLVSFSKKKRQELLLVSSFVPVFPAGAKARSSPANQIAAWICGTTTTAPASRQLRATLF